jgi:hypothetical protein
MPLGVKRYRKICRRRIKKGITPTANITAALSFGFRAMPLGGKENMLRFWGKSRVHY